MNAWWAFFSCVELENVLNARSGDFGWALERAFIQLGGVVAFSTYFMNLSAMIFELKYFKTINKNLVQTYLLPGY